MAKKLPAANGKPGLRRIVGESSSRAAELQECEKRIDSAIEAAREHYATIGRELMRIRDGKLYLGKHKTFEAYCEQRWYYSRGHAYRLIEAVKVLDDLSPQGDTEAAEVPETERQARAVGAAAPDAETRQAVWTTAQELAGDSQPAPKVIAQAAEIVTTGLPKNHESIELTEAITAFQNTSNLLIKRGKEIQAKFEEKLRTCKAMANRKIKFQRIIDNLLIQADLVSEHIESLETAWTAARGQIDE